MKSAFLALFWVSACLSHATLVGIKTTREHHIAQSTSTIALPSMSIPSHGARLSDESEPQIDTTEASPQIEQDPAQAEGEAESIFADTPSDTRDVQDDLDTIVSDPSEIRYNTQGKISFSHFQRIAFLGKTVSRLYNFVAKLFPSPDNNTSDAEHLAKSFNSIKQANQVFYTLFYDSKDLGLELQHLFELAGSVDFTFRDGLALFGFEKEYSDIAASQNVGDELFKAIKRGIEQDIDDFRVALSKMLEGIESLRNPHKYLYSRLKKYEDDYTESGALDTDTDKIAQGKKMMGVFQNLKSEYDQMGRDITAGVDSLMQTKTKLAVKLKKLAKIRTMEPDARVQALSEYAIERQLVVEGSAGRLVALGLSLCGLWVASGLGM